MLNGWNRKVRTTRAISSAWTTTLIVSRTPPSSAVFVVFATRVGSVIVRPLPPVACLGGTSRGPRPDAGAACRTLGRRRRYRPRLGPRQRDTGRADAPADWDLAMSAGRTGAGPGRARLDEHEGLGQRVLVGQR